MMKRKLSLLLLGILLQQTAFADAYTVTRKWCGGFFYRKFVATAKTSILHYTQYQTGYDCIGQYVGTGYFGTWSTICNNENKGCSRPQVATCGPNNGMVKDYIFSGCYLLLTNQQPYYAYAKAQHLTSGITLTKNSSGRGSAGQTGEFELNPTIFDALNDKGTSSVNVTGDIDIDNNNNLIINNLSGELSITNGTDYFSTLKIVVIKENTNITNEEALRNENAVLKGEYNDVVYTSEIHLSKNEIDYNGLFSNQSQIAEFSDNGLIGVRISNLTVRVPINISLSANEKLTLMAIADGGFDISSAIVKTSNRESSSTTLALEQENKTKMYPNPATQAINIELFSETDNLPVQIMCYDIKGSLIRNLYSGKLNKGTNSIKAINIADLPKGINFIKIFNGNSVITKPIILE